MAQLNLEQNLLGRKTWKFDLKTDVFEGRENPKIAVNIKSFSSCVNSQPRYRMFLFYNQSSCSTKANPLVPGKFFFEFFLFKCIHRSTVGFN